jgi:hypothetical protein
MDSPLAARLMRHFERRNRDVEVPGAAVLLRVLIRRGLPEEALPAAAALVAELDRRDGDDAVAEQDDQARLEARQRVRINADPLVKGRVGGFERVTHTRGLIGAGQPRPRDPDRVTG